MAASDGSSVSFPSSESWPCVQLSGGHTGVSLQHRWIPETSFEILNKTAGFVLNISNWFSWSGTCLVINTGLPSTSCTQRMMSAGLCSGLPSNTRWASFPPEKMNKPVKLGPLHEQNGPSPAATRACFCGSLSRLTVQDLLNSREQFFSRLDRTLKGIVCVFWSVTDQRSLCLE